MLAVSTGLRQGELVGVHWDDIDLNTGIITIKRTLKELNGRFLIGEPKSRSGFRSAYISQIAIDALKEQKNRAENLILSRINKKE